MAFVAFCGPFVVVVVADVVVVVIVVVVGPLSVTLGVGLPQVSAAAGQADCPRPLRRLRGPGPQGRKIHPPVGVRSKTKRASID
eukprot:1521834-Pyramimonas_sp.AAC.1